MKIKDDLFILIVSFAVVGTLGLILFFVYVVSRNNALNEWAEFKKENNCHLVSKKESANEYGWQCSNGIIYYNRYSE